jgi:hypothetical protein
MGKFCSWAKEHHHPNVGYPDNDKGLMVRCQILEHVDASWRQHDEL